MSAHAPVPGERETANTAATAMPQIGDQPGADHVLTPLTRWEFLFAVLALSLWFLFFSGGSLLGTVTYRNQLASPIAWNDKIKPLVVCLFFWTTSNLGILSCLAAFLGAVGFRSGFTTTLDAKCSIQKPTAAMRSMLLTWYLAAVMRGFGVYTLSTAGLILLATDAVTDAGQETYLRLAPLISIVSFYSGFNPRTFGGLLDRVQRILRTGAPGETPAARSNTQPHPPAAVNK
jgi:hypothetical protein